MTAPKRIWVNVYPGGSVTADAFDSAERAKRSLLKDCTTHEYRLVPPKREPLYWVLKCEGNYLRWATEPRDRRFAYRFPTKESALEYLKDRSPGSAFKPVPVYRKAKP